MRKSPSPLVQQTVNGMLAHIKGRHDSRLPSEAELAAMLGVSRSPVREAARILERRGVLKREGAATVVARSPRASDGFRVGATPISKRVAFERFFLERLQRGEFQPGRHFSELELAREAGLNTVTVREGLLQYARFGLIRKEPRRQWQLVKFDAAMIDELFELRELLERTALRKALALPDHHPLRARFAELLEEHRRFEKQRTHRVEDFLELDERFHVTLFKAAENRYLDEMFAAIPALIHFQLRRDPVGERGMQLGLRDHQAILRALVDRDAEAAKAAMARHLECSRMIMKLAAEGQKAGVDALGEPASQRTHRVRVHRSATRAQWNEHGGAGSRERKAESEKAK